MPGVPPNALAQVKKGLKGLFSRKKKNAKGSTSQDSSATTGAASGAKNDGNAPTMANEPTTSVTPQIAEPGNVSSSQAIDLNPAAPAPGKEEGRLDSKVAADGMSATSGPVSTDLYDEDGTGAAAMASKENVKDDASEEAIEDMEEGHAKVEDTKVEESKPAVGGPSSA